MPRHKNSATAFLTSHIDITLEQLCLYNASVQLSSMISSDDVSQLAADAEMMFHQHAKNAAVIDSSVLQSICAAVFTDSKSLLLHSVESFTRSNNNNNNNKHDNVYGAVIMAEPLREFTRFI